jgi:hypothetical protein
MALPLRLIGTLAVLALVGLALFSASATAQGACNEGVKSTGRVSVSGSATYEMQFCSDPADSLVGRVTWAKKVNPDLDVMVIVTSPSGVEFVFDNGPSASQTFTLFGPLEEGTWTVEVVNIGSRTVNYDIQAAFG